MTPEVNPAGRCQGALTVLTPAPHTCLPSAPSPCQREGTFPSAHCGLTARSDAAAAEGSGAQLGNGDPGLLKTWGKKVLPTTPSCLPACLPPPAAAKPWHLLGSARSTSGWEAQGWSCSQTEPKFTSQQAEVLLCDPGLVACLFWARLWGSE